MNYPPNADFPDFKNIFSHGVLRAWATEEDDPAEHPRWVAFGKQRIEDTGPLTKKRMETVNTEFLAATQLHQRRHADEQPFFISFNTAWMHFHVPPAGARAGPGRPLAVLLPRRHGGARQTRGPDAGPARRAAGIAADTIVVYSTDNGPRMNTWPDEQAIAPSATRAPTGRAPSACGDGALRRVRSRPVSCPTRSSATPTGCPPLLAAPASRRSTPS